MTFWRFRVLTHISGVNCAEITIQINEDNLRVTITADELLRDINMIFNHYTRFFCDFQPWRRLQE